MPAYIPDRFDLTAYQNATWTETFRIHQGSATSAVQNLTGYSAQLIVKAKPGDSTTLLSLTSGNGLTLGGTAGTITLTQSAAAVNAFSWSSAEYELLLTDSSSPAVTSVILYGSVKVVAF
jgi:hypothetical protein